MKKALHIILILSLVISNITATVMAKDEATNEKAVTVLKGLGYFDYSEVLLDKEITRAEYIDILATVTGLQDEINIGKWAEYFYGENSDTSEGIGTTSGRFIDVPSDYWAYDAIQKMADAGYISGVSENTFEPDRTLEYREMLSVMLGILGYKQVAAVAGGWADGDITVACELSLTSGIDCGPGSGVTRKEVAQMLYNSFDVGMFEWKENGYVVSKTKTFLSEVLKLRKTKGIVTANSDTTFTTELNQKQGYLEIDNYGYNDVKGLYGGLIGREVEAYYSIDDVTEDEIVYAFPIDDIKEINISDIDDFRNGVIYYNVSGRSKSLNIKKLPVIYNGVALATYDDSLFDYKNGTVKVPEDENAVIIEAYVSGYVLSVDSVGYKVYDTVSNGSFTIDESKDNVKIYDEQGNLRSFSYILPGSVISIAQNSRQIKVYVSDKKAQGSISAVNDGEDCTVQINGTSYNVADSFRNSEDYSCIEAGNTVTAYIDVFGNIVWAQLQDKTAGQRAYLLKAWLTEDDEKLQIKVFNTSGEIVTLKTAEKIIVLTAEDEEDRLDNVEAYKKLREYDKGYLKFKMNSNEEVSSIEIPSTTAPKIGERRSYMTLDVLEGDTAINYNSDAGHFTNLAHIDTNTFIVGLPEDVDAYEDYKLLSRTDFSTNTAYHIKCYSDKYGSTLCDAMITTAKKSENYASSGENLFVVTKRYVLCNEDDEIVDCIVISNGSREKEIYASIDEKDLSGKDCSLFDIPFEPSQSAYASPIKVGDIVLCIADSKNYVTKICKIFDPDKENVKYSEGNRGGMPGVDTDYYYVPIDTVDFTTGKNIVMQTGFTATAKSNPVTINSSAMEWSPHQFYVYPSSLRMMIGYVYYNSGDMLTYTTQDLSASDFIETGIPTEDSTLTTGERENYVGIYLIDRWRTTGILGSHWVKTVTYSSGPNGKTLVDVKKGTYADVLDNYSVGKNCSRILTSAYNNVGREAIIINDNRE